MHLPDADIPAGYQGDQTLLIVPQHGTSPFILTHRLEDGAIDDPRFRALPVHLRIEGLSSEAAAAISYTLRTREPGSPLPTRTDLLAALR